MFGRGLDLFRRLSKGIPVLVQKSVNISSGYQICKTLLRDSQQNAFGFGNSCRDLISSVIVRGQGHFDIPEIPESIRVIIGTGPDVVETVVNVRTEPQLPALVRIGRVYDLHQALGQRDLPAGAVEPVARRVGAEPALLHDHGPGELAEGAEVREIGFQQFPALVPGPDDGRDDIRVVGEGDLEGLEGGLFFVRGRAGLFLLQEIRERGAEIVVFFQQAIDRGADLVPGHVGEVAAQDRVGHPEVVDGQAVLFGADGPDVAQVHGGRGPLNRLADCLVVDLDSGRGLGVAGDPLARAELGLFVEHDAAHLPGQRGVGPEVRAGVVLGQFFGLRGRQRIQRAPVQVLGVERIADRPLQAVPGEVLADHRDDTGVPGKELFQLGDALFRGLAGEAVEPGPLGQPHRYVVEPVAVVVDLDDPPHVLRVGPAREHPDHEQAGHQGHAEPEHPGMPHAAHVGTAFAAVAEADEQRRQPEKRGDKGGGDRNHARQERGRGEDRDDDAGPAPEMLHRARAPDRLRPALRIVHPLQALREVIPPRDNQVQENCGRPGHNYAPGQPEDAGFRRSGQGQPAEQSDEAGGGHGAAQPFRQRKFAGVYGLPYLILTRGGFNGFFITQSPRGLAG